MNKNDELTGTFVLVNPQLTNDPAGMQNKIGVITSAEVENDNVFVSFGKDGQALYSANALLVLRRHDSIHFDAIRGATKMDVQDFKDLLRVSIFANSPFMKDRREAMEMARDSRTVLEYSMISLEEDLGLKQEFSVER
jgi:hypothetical protein